MHPQGGALPAASSTPTTASGTLIGKRYADAETGLELLCTKGGDGSLSLGDDAAAPEGRQDAAILGLRERPVHLSMLLEMAADGFGDRVAFGSREPTGSRTPS